jgi:hypothetical protein
VNNPIVVISANVLSVLVIACAVKLFDLGSTFAYAIRKYGVYLAILLGVVAAFVMILPDLLEIADGNTIAIVSVVMVLACSFLAYEFSILRRIFLEPKRKKSRANGRASRWSVASVTLMDMISGAMVGATAGIAYTLNLGAGLMTTCAVILFQTHIKVDLIDRYWHAFFKRGENIFILVMSLLAQLAAALVVYLYVNPHFNLFGVFIAAGFGYLLYLCISRFFMIAKSRKSK